MRTNTAHVDEGTANDGSGWLCLGRGPALVLSTGFMPRHGPARGVWRRMMLSTMAAFADDFQVWSIGRPAGLPDGTTTRDLSAALRRGIHELIGEPVALVGYSTGSSIALQAVLDEPALVSRLVIADGACRLTEHGRRLHARVARELHEGAQWRAWRHLMQGTDGPLTGLMTATLGYLAPNTLRTRDPRDAAATLHADVDFDVTDRLHEIDIPTLVIGGSEDPLYGPEPIQDTAARIRNSHLMILDGQGHMATRHPWARGLIRAYLTDQFQPHTPMPPDPAE